MRVRRCMLLAVVVLSMGGWSAAWGLIIQCEIQQVTVDPPAAPVMGTVHCGAVTQASVQWEEEDEGHEDWVAEHKYTWTFEDGYCTSTPADAQQVTCAFTAPGVKNIHVVYEFTFRDKQGNVRGTATDEADAQLTVLQLLPAVTALWYFDGVNPGAPYATQVTWMAEGATTGAFEWTVTAGADKVDLEGGTDHVIKYNDSTVAVSSTGYSLPDQLDVTIQLKYSGFLICTGALTVFRPSHAEEDATPSDDPYNGGYWTTYCMPVVDQFWHDIPYAVMVNEWFGPAEDEFPGEDPVTWNLFWPIPGPTQGRWDDVTGRSMQVVIDGYRRPDDPETYPDPVGPTDDGADTPVRSQLQAYHAGSVESGRGATIRAHTLREYLGYSRQEAE